MAKFDFSVIKTLRMKWNITADELAKQACVTRTTIVNLENGGHNPTIETIDSISNVFKLSPSELVKLSEVIDCEEGQTEHYKSKNAIGMQIRFPDFEIFYFQSKKGRREESDPKKHENTAEVCVVITGKVKAIVGENSYILSAGMSIRFKALQEHYFVVLEDAEFILIHHILL